MRKRMKNIVAILTVTCILAIGCSCGSDDKTIDKWESTTEETTTSSMETTTKIPESTTMETTTKTPESTTKETTINTPETTIQWETTTAQKQVPTGNTPFEQCGRLSVSGTNLVDQFGNPFQLKGASTHGIAWFPQFVSYDTFKYLRDEFGANVVRIAMYTDEYGGYCSGGNKEDLKNLVKKGVDEATKLGMYVIIDWHILHDTNPQQNKGEAINFFREISSIYKNQENIIYEICNEPNGGTRWDEIKAYAMEVIPVIRANDSDAIIVVGTPNWSQDVDAAAGDKIEGYDNIMYTLHFYAATHKQWLRDKAQTAINSGLALFVTEFSICDASGNGALDINEANKWMEFLNKNHIGYVGWNLANKAESSSMFQSWCNKTSGFDDSDLSEWAKWLKGVMRK